MKKCSKCGENKSTSEFSKCKSNKDGLQYQCRECNRISNSKFRTEINPLHHSQWQNNNMDRVSELVAKFRRADKSSKIYAITNPLGETYIGMTNTPFSVRIGEHRKCYRKNSDRIPLLYQSFDKYGYDNHKMNVILELEGIDRKQLGFIETSFIQAYKEIGKSLNKRLK